MERTLAKNLLTATERFKQVDGAVLLREVALIEVVRLYQQAYAPKPTSPLELVHHPSARAP